MNERREANTNQERCHISGTTKPSGSAWNTEPKPDLHEIEEHQPEEVQPNGYRPSSVLDSVGNLTTIQQLYSNESLHSGFCSFTTSAQPTSHAYPPPPSEKKK